MADRKVLIGDIAAGVVLHQQADWTPETDRLADPDGRVLALLSEIDSEDGSSGGGGVNTIYVDAERTDEYTPDGTFDMPYVLLQDGIEALMAMSPDGTQFHGALVVSPSAKYLAQTDELVMILPSDSVTNRYLAIVTDSIGPSDGTVLPPLRIDSPSNASTNNIVMKGLSFASTASAETDKVLYVKGHASFTGELYFYFSDVQFNAIHAGNTAFYVDDGGGYVDITASGQTVFNVDESSSGNAITMERGWMSLRDSNILGGAAPAVNLSGTASLSLANGQLHVIGGTDTDLVHLADTASINLRDVGAAPMGTGNIITHTGTGGYIGVYDVMVNGESSGQIIAPAGVTVLLGVCSHSNGLAVAIDALPSQIVRAVPGRQVGYEDGASVWADSAPRSIGDAVDRLAMQLSAHLGTNIPL